MQIEGQQQQQAEEEEEEEEKEEGGMQQSGRKKPKRRGKGKGKTKKTMQAIPGASAHCARRSSRHTGTLRRGRVHISKPFLLDFRCFQCSFGVFVVRGAGSDCFRKNKNKIDAKHD